MDYRFAIGDLERRPFAPGVEAGLVNGMDYGLGAVSLMFGEVAPGGRVPLHRHDYDEVFVVTSGQGEWTIGAMTVNATVGDVVVVPAGVAHTFANSGNEPLRQIAVHAAAAVAMEWLDGR